MSPAPRGNIGSATGALTPATHARASTRTNGRFAIAKTANAAADLRMAARQPSHENEEHRDDEAQEVQDVRVPPERDPRRDEHERERGVRRLRFELDLPLALVALDRPYRLELAVGRVEPVAREEPLPERRRA